MYIDLLICDNFPLLHVFVTATYLSATTILSKYCERYIQFLKKNSASFIVLLFSSLRWLPDRITSDQRSTFKSIKGYSLVNSITFLIRLFCVVAHSLLKQWKKVHDPQRQIFRKARHAYTSACPRTILKVTIETINVNTERKTSPITDCR